MSKAATTKRDSRAVLAIRVLAGQTAGLPAARIAELAGEDMTSPAAHRNYATALNKLEQRGLARRDGPRRQTVWFITESGRDALASGRLRSAPGGFTHGTNFGYSHAGCRCSECRAWASAYHRKWYPGSISQQAAADRYRQWRAENPDEYSAKTAEATRNYVARNVRSRETADRHNSQWTGTEMELVSREDLTTAELADMLGRTLVAVRTMRLRLKGRNPRDRMLRDGTPPTSRSGSR